MRTNLPLWARFVLAATTAVLLPSVLKVLLRAELSWPLLIALVLGNLVLSAAAIRLNRFAARLFRILSILYTLAFTVVVLTGILISPDSAYSMWFETVRDGEPRGLVSNVMVLLAAVFSSALARRFLDSEILLPVYSQFLVAAGLLALIFQTRVLNVLLLCLLALGAGVLSVRFVRRGDRMRNLATFFLLFVGLVGLSRLPLLIAEPRGSRIVSDRLHPGLRKTVVALFPRFPLLYGIPGYGYGFETDRLGGTPVLTEAAIFEIRGRPGQRLYLRTGAYSIYDGSSWSKRTSSEESTSHPAVSPTGETLRILPLKPGEVPVSTLKITVLAEYFALIPFTLQTRAVYLPPEQIEGMSGNFEGGYRLNNPLPAEQTIYLLYRFSDGKNGSEEIGDSTETLPAGQRSAYLQLPGDIGSEIRGLSAALSDPAGNSRATLRNIERYLARNYTYNLEADRPPPGADFVSYFLFHSREGYCVHFASAFALLARLNGIPVRYATGYLATLPGDSSPFERMEEPGRGIVTGLSAHAWPEVWLEDRGWTAWEATTAVNPAYYEETGQEWLYEYGRVANRLTNRQLRAILGRLPGSRDREAVGPGKVDWQILFLSIPAIALVLLTAWTVRRYGILLVASLRPDRKSAVKMVGKIAAAFQRREVERPETLGWVRWTAAVSAAAPHLETDSARLLTVIQRLMYSDQKFRRPDLDIFRTLYLKLYR